MCIPKFEMKHHWVIVYVLLWVFQTGNGGNSEELSTVAGVGIRMRQTNHPGSQPTSLSDPEFATSTEN